jgi:hypothetical protein
MGDGEWVSHCVSLVRSGGGLNAVLSLGQRDPQALCTGLSSCASLASPSLPAASGLSSDVLVAAEDAEDEAEGGSDKEGMMANLAAAAFGKVKIEDEDEDEGAAEAKSATHLKTKILDSSKLKARGRAGLRARAGNEPAGQPAAAAAAPAPHPGAAAEAAVGEIMGSGMTMMQERQMMETQMQQQQMAQIQMLRMRMMSIMNSNRQLKKQEKNIQRHMPGGCDCCQACPPPPAVSNQASS